MYVFFYIVHALAANQSTTLGHSMDVARVLARVGQSTKEEESN